MQEPPATFFHPPQRKLVSLLLAVGIALALLPAVVTPAGSLYVILLFILPFAAGGLGWFVGGTNAMAWLDYRLLLSGRAPGAEPLPMVPDLEPAMRAALEQAAIPALLGHLSATANGLRPEMAEPARRLLMAGRVVLMQDDEAAIAMLAHYLPPAIEALEEGRQGAGEHADALAEATSSGAEAEAVARVDATAASMGPKRRRTKKGHA